MKINTYEYPRPASKGIRRKKNGSNRFAEYTEIHAKTTIKPEEEVKSELLEMQLEINKSDSLIKKLRKQLDESDSKNARIFSIIAHDLRSPFQVILGFLELVKMNLQDRKDYESLIDYINMAYESANNTLKQLDELLHWSMTQNSEKNINPVKIDLSDLVSKEIILQITSADQKGISLKHSIIRGLNASGDVQMVKAIFRNLISNAVKFTNRGGEIIISALENKQKVEICVTDTGIGMSPEQINELFSIDSLHTTKGTNYEVGYGFGLMLCKKFIELHGGILRVESILHKGSKFIFTLPHYI